MFFNFSGYSSCVGLLYAYLVQMFSYYYLVLMLCVLSLFLSYRFPYVYSPFVFIVFLVCVVFTCFLAMFLWRIASDFHLFFSGFIPVGTPLYICPLVCLAETISYIIRPFVLIFRPFINITLGCVGAVALSNFCFVSWGWFFVLMLLFFYEVFVALVHWFIVTNILAFSVDH
uniref:ATP synthase F0 subunit 6 n=1 Tax=Senga ophiocephalina TaxID=1981834 RepID=A0A343C6Q9_9CEST|nr:ATP synthase F0 subunit 6 [Senga ophiocephalina]ARK18841.1 ATP synthase F0 subunit 6 [Senga ophiocephalina]